MTDQDLKGWVWQPDKCPADRDFVEYCQNQSQDRELNIFHMGTGLHHIVGRRLAGETNLVVGATISPDEVNAYLEMMNESERWHQNYLLHYGDLNRIEERVVALRRWDYVTLFHLGEIKDTLGDAIQDEKDRYELDLRHAIQDWRKTIKLFGNYLAVDGRLVFYTGPVAYHELSPLVNQLCEPREEYRSLQFYTLKGAIDGTRP